MRDSRTADALEALLESIHRAADDGNMATVGRDLVAAQKQLARLRKECGLVEPRRDRMLAKALGVQGPVHLSVMRQQSDRRHLWNYETACGLLWDGIGRQTVEPSGANCPACLKAFEKGLPDGVVLSKDGVGDRSEQQSS